MATMGTQALTLLELGKRVDPDGRIAMITELLNQTNPNLNDRLWIEGNMTTGHRHSVRTRLPSVGTRRLNEGVATDASTTAQIDEICALFEGFSEVDEALLELASDRAAARMTEDLAWVEALNQKMATTLFYGDSKTTPGDFDGLTKRYNSTTGDTKDNVVTAGGSGSDNMSIWIVSWSPTRIFGIYPKNTQAGLEMNDLGLETKQITESGIVKKYRVWSTQFKWRAGLAVKDWRYAVRVCNIDYSDLKGGTGPDLTNLMIDAIDRLPSKDGGNTMIYVPRAVHTWWWKQLIAKSNAALSTQDYLGRPQLTFQGFPVKIVDALTASEALVS